MKNSFEFLFLFLFCNVMLGQDPGLPGSYSYQKLEYNLGNYFQPTDYNYRFVEVKGSVHRPIGNGPFPIIFIMHGRHATCYNSNGNTNIDFPCNNGYNEIPNYAGYDYLGEHLASHGFITISISANGIIGASGTSDYPADRNAKARAELVQHHLDLWNTWNTQSNGPFGSTFLNKIDMSNIITVGHSRGGEGMVRHYIYNKSLGSPYQINGVFTVAPTAYTNPSDGAMNIAFMSGDCDGDVEDLMGLFYYDDARYQYPNSGGGNGHCFILNGANHNYFNSTWTPGDFPAGAFDDWLIVDSNNNDAYCGVNNVDNERITALQQRNVLKAYLNAFAKTYTNQSVDYLDLLHGLASTPNSTLLNNNQIHTSFHPKASFRMDINQMESIHCTYTNNLGGLVSNSGLNYFAACGINDNACGFNTSNDDHHCQYLNGSHSLGRVRIDWNSIGVWYKNEIPFANRNVIPFTHLLLRVGMNMNIAGVQTNTQNQNFTIALQDRAQDIATVLVNDFSNALELPKGSTPDILPRSINQMVIIPLQEFSIIDLSNLQNIQFIFDQTQQGSLNFSEITFVSLPRYLDLDQDGIYADADPDDLNACIPSINNLNCCEGIVKNNSGNIIGGSLLHNISCASSGDTILFDSQLGDAIITLNETNISLTKDLTLLAPTSTSIKISGKFFNTTIEITANHHISIQGLIIESGFNNQGRAIINNGILHLKNVSIVEYYNNLSGSQIANYGELYIDSLLSLKKY